MRSREPQHAWAPMPDAGPGAQQLTPLRAGPLRLLLDASTGFLRRIQLGDREVLRGIYGAIRDQDWGTVPMSIEPLASSIAKDHFEITFIARSVQPAIPFAWRGTIEGRSNGSLRYTFDGEALGGFRRNRIGLCVLHPIRECAGVAARQQRMDGTVLACAFPDLIEPQVFGQASFRDLRAVCHQVLPGLWAEVRFEGDVFEMEDQRNWSDASFKTYSTPLALPFPVRVEPGTRIRQCVSLRLFREGNEPGPELLELAPKEPSTRDASDGAAEVCAASLRAASLGVCVATHGADLTDADIARLQALRLSHLRIDLRMDRTDWLDRWQRDARQARQLGCAIELALHLSREDHGTHRAARECIEAAPAPIARVLALRAGESSTSHSTLREVRSLLAGLNLPIGAGSDANFCELNRDQHLGRCAVDGADFLFWSLNPQVHATDDVSVMETIEAQSEQVRTARVFAPGLPLVVTPITLKPRFNAVATSAEPTPAPGSLPGDVDPRQAETFAAAWTLRSHAAMCAAGVSSLTYFETTGWRGLFPARDECFAPETPSGVYPIYHGLASLAGGA